MLLAHRLVIAVMIVSLSLPLARLANADKPAWFDSATQTTLYFGLKTNDGKGISEQAWTRFLAEVVTPRFPDGLTVLSAYGQGGSDPASAGQVLAEMTKMLVIVRPDTPEAAQKIEEIKAEFRRLYSPTGIFHTEGAVRVVE
jgi:hypothetical protein